MVEVIKFSPINDKLKYQYSTYVSNYCIGKVNDQEISNYEALVLMKQAYFSQHRIQESVKILFL